jgi:hypothetical protein
MVFNATFNNISPMSWKSFRLKKNTRYPNRNIGMSCANKRLQFCSNMIDFFGLVWNELFCIFLSVHFTRTLPVCQLHIFYKVLNQIIDLIIGARCIGRQYRNRIIFNVIFNNFVMNKYYHLVHVILGFITQLLSQ